MAESDWESPVASLYFRNASLPERVYHVHANDEFDLGRRQIKQAWGVDELTISTHHLRFRCVVFEDEEEDKSALLIYVRVLSFNPVLLSRSDSNNPSGDTTLSRESGDVLLNHGDVLKLTRDMSLLFRTAKQPETAVRGLDPIKEAEVKRFAKQYRVTGRMLGAGGNASVFVAVKQSTQRQVACKIVPLPYKRPGAPALDQRLQATDAKELESRLIKKRESLAREYNVLKYLNHPNIICLEKVFCASYNIYIFQELVTGGDLLSFMEKMGALGEPQTAVIVRQIVEAIEYLHGNQIVHRDIKPENVLLTSWREGARIVLTDFGQARTLEDTSSVTRSSAVFRMQSVVGTYGYTAPEVYQQLKRDLQKETGYSKAIDMWSIGCIAATLLTNDLIFSDNGHNHAVANNEAGAQSMDERWGLGILDTSTIWQGISRKAKSFVRGCLNVDETARLTAKQALLHTWFTNKHYAAEIEAAYQRAIHDWKPRGKSGSLVEFIDTMDAVPLAERPGHVKRLVEETKSRHFPLHIGAKPPPNAFDPNQVYHPPPKQRHTPLPAIAEESEGDVVRTPSADDIVKQEALYVSSTCIPNSPLGKSHAARHSFEQLSIDNYAPIDTQAFLSETLPPPPPDWTDSVAQSQSMLDELSPPKYYSQSGGPAAPASANGKKRTSSFSDIDELDESLMAAVQGCGSHPTAATGGRKKVHR